MKLREWLDKSGMDDAEFAEKIGKSPSFVSYLASGSKRPSLDTIDEIARVTKGEVTANDFMRKARPRKPPARPKVAVMA